MENRDIWKCDNVIVKKRGEKGEKKENRAGIVQVVGQKNIRHKFLGPKKRFVGFVKGNNRFKSIFEDDLRFKVKVRADRNKSQLVGTKEREGWIRNKDIQMEFLLYKTFECSKNNYSLL